MNKHTEELNTEEAVSEHEEKDYVRKTFEIEEDLADMMEREAYWERKTNKEVLNEALAEYFKSRQPKPFPNNYKRIVRGRKPQ